MYNQEPSPRGWYRNPDGPGQRYFNGADWTDAVSDNPNIGGTDLPGAPAEPRSTLMRAALTAGIFLVLAIPSTWSIASVRWLFDGFHWVAPVAATDTARYLIPAVVMAIVGPRISYRRRDWLLMLVPLYGWYLMFVIGWRLSYLPYRDWSPRPDEAASWQQLRHPQSPGNLLYRKRPAEVTVP
jgi:hypothetical protein